jgi:DnaJ-class molecular chaperone
MPATTQQTERTEAGYLVARAAYYEALAASYEAAASKFDADPQCSEATREDMTSYYRGAARVKRAEAAADRANAAGAACLACGGTGRYADHPCPKCEPTEDMRPLLSALGVTIHAEASHG